jgi:hypothetical protein
MRIPVFLKRTSGFGKVGIHNDELKKIISDAIFSYYPDMKDVYIRFIPQWNSYKIRVFWTDGESKYSLYETLFKIITEHNKKIGDKYVIKYNIEMCRCFSDEVILKQCEKYSSAFPQGIQMSINLAKCLKIGECTVYKIAINDMNDMDEVI